MARDEWALSVLKMIVVDELAGVRSALEVAKQSVRVATDNRLNQFEKDLAELGSDDPERTKLEAQYSSWKGWHEQYLPRILAGAFLTYTFAVVEDILREFAKNAQRDKGLVLGLGDINGPAIDRALTYLQKAARLNVGRLAGWQVLREFQDLRNALVHRAGRLGDNTKERANLKRMANRYSGLLKVSDWTLGHAQLEFGPELVECFAREADALFEGMLGLMYSGREGE